jgi:prepilin-type processing-associated H-X9-DG protein
MKARRSHRRQGRTGHQAFTRLEALTLTATGALLFFLVLPTLSQSREGAWSALCVENHRRLIRAFHLYADDHAGRFVPLAWGSHVMGQVPSRPAWIHGWLDWGTSSHNTNLLHLSDPTFSLTANYLDEDPTPYKCPADRFLSGTQQARGWDRRIRSVSANALIAPYPNQTLSPLSATTHQFSDLVNPGPAKTIVYLEEHPDSINDAAFSPPQDRRWVDMPIALHQGASTFSFTDGHVEPYLWSTPIAQTPVRHASGLTPNVPPNDPDLLWYNERMPTRRAP